MARRSWGRRGLGLGQGLILKLPLSFIKKDTKEWWFLHYVSKKLLGQMCHLNPSFKKWRREWGRFLRNCFHSWGSLLKRIGGIQTTKLTEEHNGYELVDGDPLLAIKKKFVDLLDGGTPAEN
ncbi:hypothetical protein ACJIZ3_011727 [Penstemon smallii]|uniref:Uncharacterized protein n=1 Tax=Penstemon smallii TaxID=265156 RepID=A0ABD3UKC5_9LAMI